MKDNVLYLPMTKIISFNLGVNHVDFQLTKGGGVVKVEKYFTNEEIPNIAKIIEQFQKLKTS